MVAAVIVALLGLAVLFLVVRAAVRSAMKPAKTAEPTRGTHDGRSLDQWASENRRHHA